MNKKILEVHETMTYNPSISHGYSNKKSFNLTNHTYNFLNENDIKFSEKEIGITNLEIKCYGNYSIKLKICGDFIDEINSDMRDDSDIACIDLLKNNIIPLIGKHNPIELDAEYSADVRISYDVIKITQYDNETSYLMTEFTQNYRINDKGEITIKIDAKLNVEKIYVLVDKFVDDVKIIIGERVFYPESSEYLKHVFEFDKELNLKNENKNNILLKFFSDNNNLIVSIFVKSENILITDSNYSTIKWNI